MSENGKTIYCHLCDGSHSYTLSSQSHVDDDAGIRDCSVCGNSCKDDVTMDDHGMCYDCHHMVLNGELCADCLEERPCECDDDDDWREEALTDAERNPSLVTRGLY
jgi:hypothetical protein